MKPLILIFLCLPALLCAQEFQFRQEFDTIPVEIDGWYPQQPWMGGFSKSCPKFCDIDANGIFDLFIGNFLGYISFFQGIDSLSTIKFEFVTSEFDNLTVYGQPWGGSSAPCFADVDADGDYDCFLGCVDGWIKYYRNDGTPQIPDFTLIADTLSGISYYCAHPALVDINADGLLELFGGNWTQISYYENIGTPQSFNFHLVTLSFANITVGSSPAPFFCDIDADGDYDLFIGNEAGNIWFYRNDGTPRQYNFTFVTDNYNNIDAGDYASPEFADIDGDGDYDLFVGRECPGLTNSPGDIFYYENIGTPANAQWQLVTTNFLSLDVGNRAQGATTDIDADNDRDLFIGNSNSYISYYQNVGTPDSAAFSWITDTYQNIHVLFGSPFFCDINGDTAPDLFLGEAVVPNPPYPGLYLYQNVGTPQNAVFSLYSTNLVPGNYEVIIIPALADIDGDGDKDLFFTTDDGSYYFFENVGSPTRAQFVYRANHWQEIILPGGAMSSCFFDIDHDGDLDLFLSDGNQLRFYRNQGTPLNAQMILETDNFLGEDHLPFESLDIFDIDNDGDGDFLLSTGNGGMVFYRNITGDSTAVLQPTKMRPRPSRATLSIGPNPSNPVTAISYQLSAVSLVNLSVYDISGRRVAQLVNGRQNPGEYTVSWNASGNASGVYLVRLETSGGVVTRKVVVLK